MSFEIALFCFNTLCNLRHILVLLVIVPQNNYAIGLSLFRD